MLCVVLLLALADCAAQVSGSVALVSDYRYRGVSLSDRRPALQAGAAYDHSSGLYAGAFASTVHVSGADSSLSAQFYGGYAHLFDQRISLDLGVAQYLYPESPTRGPYDYTEVYGGVARDRVHVRLHYSDSYYGNSAQAGY